MAVTVKYNNHHNFFILRFYSGDRRNLNYDPSTDYFGNSYPDTEYWTECEELQVNRSAYVIVFIKNDPWLLENISDVDVKCSQSGWTIILHFKQESAETEFILRYL